MKKTVLALLAAVFILSIGVGAADAAWITGFSTAKRVLQNAHSTMLTGVTASNDVRYRLATGETLASNDNVTITLGGGAKFATTQPTITGSNGDFPIVGTWTGQTTATFRAAVAAAGTDLVFNTSGTIFNLQGQTGAVTFTISATTVVGGAQVNVIANTSASGGPFAAASAMETVTVTAKTDTANVSTATGAFKNFVTPPAQSATLGQATVLSYKNLSGTDAMQDSVPTERDVAATKVVFGIEGTMTGIASISGTGCTGSNSAGSQVGGTANLFKISGNTAYCSNTAVIAPQATLALAPAFTLDGTTAQAARSFTTGVTFVADGTVWLAHTAQASGTALFTIARNGSSFVTNSVGPRNTIKITDRSGGLGTAGGLVTVAAYDVNGVALTDSGAALSLPNNGTLTLTGTALAARFAGGTAMRYDFSVESASIVVTNVKASVDGNMSATTIFTSGSVTATGIAQGI